MDLGGRDGRLKILLGSVSGVYKKDLHRQNLARFHNKFNYTGCDLKPTSERVIAGDLCYDSYVSENSVYTNYFDVIYSNNVFEHLRRPWVTVKHIDKMLKPNGICVIVAPFSQRYHKSPDDYFRYTHTAIENLFRSETKMNFSMILTAYVTFQRRMNIFGRKNDALVEDSFGGCRETWYTVTILRKLEE